MYQMNIFHGLTFGLAISKYRSPWLHVPCFCSLLMWM